MTIRQMKVNSKHCVLFLISCPFILQLLSNGFAEGKFSDAVRKQWAEFVPQVYSAKMDCDAAKEERKAQRILLKVCTVITSLAVAVVHVLLFTIYAFSSLWRNFCVAAIQMLYSRNWKKETVHLNYVAKYLKWVNRPIHAGNRLTTVPAILFCDIYWCSHQVYLLMDRQSNVCPKLLSDRSWLSVIVLSTI